jgi:hypothetical protein
MDFNDVGILFFPLDGPAMYVIKPTNVQSTGALFTVTVREASRHHPLAV